MRHMLPLFVLVVLVGCKGSREKDVVGTWTAPQISITVTEDKKFTSTMGGQAKLDGTWAIEGNDVTFTPVTMMGQPVAEVKAKLAPLAASMSADQKKGVDSLDKPNVVTLSDDGKTMTTNQEKDKNGGPTMTLTKS